MKKITLILLILFYIAAVIAQNDKQNVAVYMAGKEPVGAKGAHKMVGGELVKAISKSDKYSAINRTDEILQVIAKEHGYQRSGAVSDEQIKTLGQQFGVQYLCIAEISEVKGGSFYLDVRLVDVVTATTINSATATNALKNNNEMMAVAQQVARELVGGGGETGSASSFTDSRDGKTYRKVTVDRQTWMAENLNYNVSGSKCYGYDGKIDVDWDEKSNPIVKTKKLSNSEIQANCVKYGRLYTWDAAKRACPAGWHLPRDAEWITLTDYIGGSSTAGKKLKSTSGWDDKDNSTNEYGFSALPDGGGDIGSWWSATEGDANSAWVWGMISDVEYVLRDVSSKAGLFSVRCVQDLL